MNDDMLGKETIEQNLCEAARLCERMNELIKQWEGGLISSVELMDSFVLHKNCVKQEIEEAQVKLMR